MANKSFASRRMPQSSTQASSVQGMVEHIQHADPHSQYLKKEDYAGGSGTIDLANYVVYDVYNTHLAAFNTFQGAVTAWQNEYTGWRNNTVTPKLEDIDNLNSRVGDIEIFESDHVAPYAQGYTGVLPAHKDTEGKELYARRIHTHTLTDFNAAAADHNHDNDYLKINDLYNSRQTPAGTSVPALSDTFAPAQHGHSEYVNYSELEVRGIYPSANNPFVSEADETITVTDVNALIEQGIYNLHPQSGQSLANSPVGAGMLVVFEDDVVEGVNTRDENTNAIIITTYGKHVAVQILFADTGIIRQRKIETIDAIAYAWTSEATETTEAETVYTKTATGTSSLDVFTTTTMGSRAGVTSAGSTSSITFNGVVYTRDTLRDTVGSTITYGAWYISSAPSRVKANTNSGTAYAMSVASADIHNITLNANCTLTVNYLNSGETAYLYVTTNGSYTLTYNNVVLLSNEDSGTFRIEFQNSSTSNSAAAKCIGIAAVLA